MCPGLLNVVATASPPQGVRVRVPYRVPAFHAVQTAGFPVCGRTVSAVRLGCGRTRVSVAAVGIGYGGCGRNRVSVAAVGLGFWLLQQD